MFDLHNHLSHLERVRTMRPNGKLELKEKFVGSGSDAVIGSPVLTSNLTEFTWKVGQDQRLPTVCHRCRIGTAGTIVPASQVPATSQLIIGRNEKSFRILRAVWLIAAAPDKFRAADKGVVHRSLQRFPADRRIPPVELRCEPSDVIPIDDAGCVVTVRYRKSEIQIRIVCNVFVCPQVTDVCQVAALGRCVESITGSSFKSLACRFKENQLVRNQPGNGEAG